MRKFLPLLVVCLCTTFSAVSQCSTATLDWDALDYLATTGYSNTTAQTISPSQYFAIGKNRLNIQYTRLSPNTISSVGENTSHTGETGSYGTGADVQYNGNGTITLTFTDEVTNLKFSLYDVDKNQTVQVSASNAANIQQNITVTTLGASILTVPNNGLTNPTITAGNSVASTSEVTASCNVDIAGPVKTITLTVSNTGTVTSGAPSSQEDGSYWLSDISACVTGSFPTNYYQVARPLAGQPGYVLVAVNNTVYYVDPATGNSKFLFIDGATSASICSMAYDSYNQVVYYVWSLTNNGAANASERTLRKYDLKTQTATTLLTDIRSLGIPTYDQGVETAGAAFYDGAWYIGIEGGADRAVGGGPPGGTNRESVIWRIDFNSSGVPVSATQVYGINGDTNDWGDFSIYDGMLYNFNADPAYANYTHYNLQTGANQAIAYSGTAPKQTAVGWDGTIYWVNNTIAPYNKNGTIGTQRNITASGGIPNWSNTSAPLFTDGGEPYRPPFDFGDAPDTYDPDPLSPAMHEYNANLRLGSVSDWEWAKTGSVSANADGSDEDGLTYVRIYVDGANYQTDLRVYNNTGANATVCAWLDLDNNGVFDAGEGVSYQVPPGSGIQNVSLFWNSLTSTLTNNSNTYLRVRITSEANGMTVNNPTGIYLDGEVEDYYVVVSNTPLAVKLTDFTARKIDNEKVSLGWTVTDEEPNTHYKVERSADGQTWSSVYTQTAQKKNSHASYETQDPAPISGDNYYRLKITRPDGVSLFSSVRKVAIEKEPLLLIAPNPASTGAKLSVQVETRTTALLRVVDMSGRELSAETYVVERGLNLIPLPVERLASGIYQVEWRVAGSGSYTKQLVVRK
jgi:hypothetical protein